MFYSDNVSIDYSHIHLRIFIHVLLSNSDELLRRIILNQLKHQNIVPFLQPGSWIINSDILSIWDYTRPCLLSFGKQSIALPNLMQINQSFKQFLIEDLRNEIDQRTKDLIINSKQQQITFEELSSDYYLIQKFLRMKKLGRMKLIIIEINELYIHGNIMTKCHHLL